MCDNLKTEIEALRAKGVECSMVAEEGWGSITKIRLPGGGELAYSNPNIPGRDVNIRQRWTSATP